MSVWIAAGGCAHGLAGAGGIGKVMGEWIVDGRPEWDVWPLDLRRFGRQYGSRAYTLARSYEALSQYYDIKYPCEEKHAGRPLRVSPVFSLMRLTLAPATRSPVGSFTVPETVPVTVICANAGAAMSSAANKYGAAAKCFPDNMVAPFDGC